jgi:hypothetical protein
MLQNRRKYVKDKESGKRSSKIEITRNLRGDCCKELDYKNANDQSNASHLSKLKTTQTPLKRQSLTCSKTWY